MEEKEMCGTAVTSMAVPILERKSSSSIPSYTSNHIHVRISTPSKALDGSRVWFL